MSFGRVLAMVVDGGLDVDLVRPLIRPGQDSALSKLLGDIMPSAHPHILLRFLKKKENILMAGVDKKLQWLAWCTFSRQRKVMLRNVGAHHRVSSIFRHCHLRLLGSCRGASDPVLWGARSCEGLLQSSQTRSFHPLLNPFPFCVLIPRRRI